MPGGLGNYRSMTYFPVDSILQPDTSESIMHQPTLARIATVAQQGHFFSTLEENVQFVLGLVDRALEQRLDLICLPEGFNTVGLPKPRSQWAEPLDGPTVRAFSARARQGHC